MGSAADFIDPTLLAAQQTAPIPYLLPPGQQAAPSHLPDGRHDYTIHFKFQLPPSSHPSARNLRSDTFNAVEALRDLADALFPSKGQVMLHNNTSTKTIPNLTEWPTTDADFTSFFEVHVPATWHATAFVRCGISTSMLYKDLKQDGTIYHYLRANTIFMTIHQFHDMEPAPIGMILCKHPKTIYWPQIKPQCYNKCMLS